MTDVLDTINKLVDAYNSGQFNTEEGLRKMQRRLTSNIYYLTKHQIDYRAKWLSEYHKFNGTNAAAEKHADKEYPELYLCRKIIESAKGVSISMSHELGLMKND